MLLREPANIGRFIGTPTHETTRGIIYGTGQTPNRTVVEGKHDSIV